MDQDLYPDFQAILIDPESETEMFVGRLNVSSDGRLSVAFAEEGNEDPLQKFVAELNARERFLVNVPAPPGVPFQIFTQTYERSNPNFVEGMKTFAHDNYGIKLVTDEELEAEHRALEEGEAPPMEEEPVDS